MKLRTDNLGEIPVLLYQNGVIAKTEVRRPNENETAFVYVANPSADEIQHIVGDVFGCHPLVIEDCKIWELRPHADLYEDYLYMSFYFLKDDWEPYEMSIVKGKNYMIAIFPEKVPFLEEIKESLLRTPSKMKSSGRLLYEFLNICIRYYTDMVDDVEEQVEQMENQIYENPYVQLGSKIFNMKRQLHKVRRVFTEERDMLGTLVHSNTFVDDDVRYLADIFQHTNQIIEMVDTFRDALTGLLELQMSMKGDKMNEIMKTLTIVNTIFLPMMFIVGYYGTNLHLPEYAFARNYLWLWGLLVFSTIFMVYYFRRKKWM